MGDICFGIYGYDFSKQATVHGVELVPLHAYPRCHEVARAKDGLVLTGYGRVPKIGSASETSIADLTQRLVDGMTLCQQQRVVVTKLIRLVKDDDPQRLIADGRLPANLPLGARRDSLGETIGPDWLFDGSRVRFLEQFVDYTLSRSGTDPLTAASYRQIETWRLSQPFAEIDYFLAFTGLEILSRSYGPDPDNKNAAVPLSGYLRAHGFNVSQALAEEWAAGRNALFHRGQFEAIVPGSGKVIRIFDQLYPLSMLLADACLKQLGFDDGHINWNRWSDRSAWQ